MFGGKYLITMNLNIFSFFYSTGKMCLADFPT